MAGTTSTWPPMTAVIASPVALKMTRLSFAISTPAALPTLPIATWFPLPTLVLIAMLTERGSARNPRNEVLAALIVEFVLTANAVYSLTASRAG